MAPGTVAPERMNATREAQTVALQPGESELYNGEVIEPCACECCLCCGRKRVIITNHRLLTLSR